jgi:hypothetical protein
MPKRQRLLRGAVPSLRQNSAVFRLNHEPLLQPLRHDSPRLSGYPRAPLPAAEATRELRRRRCWLRDRLGRRHRLFVRRNQRTSSRMDGHCCCCCQQQSHQNTGEGLRRGGSGGQMRQRRVGWACTTVICQRREVMARADYQPLRIWIKKKEVLFYQCL